MGASTAIGVAAADELKIEKTQTVACDRRTQKGDMVSMHYHGTLADTGNKFDASYDRGQPLRFKVGSGQVIKGWDQGLLDMCIGEKVADAVADAADAAKTALADTDDIEGHEEL